MKQKIKSFTYWIFHRENHSNYTGRGYIQGIGMDISTNVISICGLKFISKISIDVDCEWIRTLKERMKLDDEQQARIK